MTNQYQNSRVFCVANMRAVVDLLKGSSVTIVNGLYGERSLIHPILETDGNNWLVGDFEDCGVVWEYGFNEVYYDIYDRLKGKDRPVPTYVEWSGASDCPHYNLLKLVPGKHYKEGGNITRLDSTDEMEPLDVEYEPPKSGDFIWVFHRGNFGDIEADIVMIVD